MKLMKLYSNKNNFKTIKFNESLNIILGKVTKAYDRDRDTHNLGKTTLIEIIDFMLLKDISSNKKHIFKKHRNKFLEYEFFLEIKLNSGKFLTIKRSVQRSSRVSFKLHKECYQKFVHLIEWDHEELSINSKIPDKNAKSILNSYLGFNVLEKYGYRQTINYFLRTQADYGNVFHLNKFAGRDINWKPFLFELLGFEGSFIYQKYESEDKYNEQEKIANEIKEKFSINTAELDKINGLIDIKQQEKNEVQKLIDEFDFYLKEQGISKDLVEELESKIAKLNTDVYNLKYDIERIKEGLNIGINFNLKTVEKIFKEVNIYFPSQLKKSYEELVKFNNEITSERSKYLKESLIKKEALIKEVEKKLIELNEERKKKLAFLKEEDSFKKFKNYQAELIQIEREISDLKSKIDNIDVIKNINEQLKDLSGEIVDKTEKIQNQIQNGNKEYRNIRLLFNQLLIKIINRKGILSITPNKKGNVEFYAEIADFNKEESTSQGEGNTYKKILCVCFDLALLIHYSNKSFYRFVYHDGSLESLDNRKKLNYLELLNEVCKEYNLQIILTMIEDDIPTMKNGEKYKFNAEQIALILTDEDNNAGRLFEMEF
ncbi:DUF2326 domain-containing protein [Crassaminicella profunda]|uniref:DUF2326 domain-containing protein n=1 Tax=Crassaminicella profunda TaxID=1286698 RepID=UPI001CA709FC|nr:DUF2326 domain-containing protein [Crassaminicella profunda]QZY56667.1 DUF2326 domain-containing protein [Crassaminicella profunda]